MRYESSTRRAETRRGLLKVIPMVGAVVVLVALIAVACNARSDDGGTPAGRIGAPSASAGPSGPPEPSRPAEPDDDGAEGDGEDTGPGTGGDPDGSGAGGGDQGGGGSGNGGGDQGSGGNQGGGDDGGDPEDEDEDEDDPVVIVVNATADATVTPARHRATDCRRPQNITVHGTISLSGGLWPAGGGSVTVEYRWILDGEAGLSQAVHFSSTGAEGVSTTMAMTGNATAAIEILSPNQSTSPDATIHLFCG